jgi:hypothetical protein
MRKVDYSTIYLHLSSWSGGTCTSLATRRPCTSIISFDGTVRISRMMDLNVRRETDDWFSTKRPPNRFQGRIDSQWEGDN